MMWTAGNCCCSGDSSGGFSSAVACWSDILASIWSYRSGSTAGQITSTTTSRVDDPVRIGVILVPCYSGTRKTQQRAVDNTCVQCEREVAPSKDRTAADGDRDKATIALHGDTTTLASVPMC